LCNKMMKRNQCSEMIKLNRKKEKQTRKHKVTKNIKSCD
jgi:hypothetical protein